jgi:glycine cleavage system aminomethyltransferase T
MTPMDVASTAQPTTLAELLQNSVTPPATGIFHGVLTPLRLDASQVESEALAAGAAVHDLGWLKRVAVRGEDRFRWLSGMVTNTVNDLAENGGAWNLVLNAQGRIQGDLTVWREGDALELEIAADQYERLTAHLEQFIIMDDVELVPLEGVATIGLTGPCANQVLARVGLPVLPDMVTCTSVDWNGMELRITFCACRRRNWASYGSFCAPAAL